MDYNITNYIMNSSTVSNFFSRDMFLRRQARTRKRPVRLCPSTSFDEPLPVIVEEDEPRSSSSFSRSSSPAFSLNSSPSRPTTPAMKFKRRHANLSASDIRIARSALVHSDNDIAQHNPTLLSSPRPAPSPPTSCTPSPEPSPDPFSLKFRDSSFRFPQPPVPTPSSISSHEQSRAGSASPTPSMATSSSTEWQPTGLPMTPPSSDDEFSYYYSSPLPPVKPLVIHKMNLPPAQDESYCPMSTTILQVADAPLAPPSPISSETSDSDDSDSEWYTRQFSSILRVPSQTSLVFPQQQSRPDSICSTLPAPTTGRGSPNTQLDPSFPRRQRRNSFLIPNYPPPPVPTSPSPSPKSAKAKRPSPALFVTPPPIRRPPPRSSIPADCVLVDEDTFVFSDDDTSAFSLSFYEDNSNPDQSPKSFYSQPSPFPPSFPSTPTSPPPSKGEIPEADFDFPVEEVEFGVNTLRPLSIPYSPINLEADIASGLEELRRAEAVAHPPFTASFSPAYDLPTGPGSASSCEDGSDESRGLRSRWSSSTLAASIHEDHARLSASAKLRSYFSGKAHHQTRGSVSSLSSSPGKPGGFRAPVPMSPVSPRRFRHARRESDVMAIGYGYAHVQRQGLRRRGSTQTVSDAGSEESTSSSGSNGLRRKPIPVEMFLRSAP